MRALYMAVDLEKNELPLFVSTSATEVANWAGVPVGNVLSAITHSEARGTRSRFVRIYFEDDDDLFVEEDALVLKGFKEVGKYIERHARRLSCEAIQVAAMARKAM